MMSFLSDVVTSRYPTTNNQLRNSSNLRQQASINDGRVTIQPVQGGKFLLLRYGLDVLAEVHNPDNMDNNMINQDNVSNSCEQSVKIDRLKQTLSEQLKEKESLMKIVTLLKNDFKKEESRNIDREIALEKKFKQLDNIKAQQLEPKLYDGNVIKSTSAIMIPDFEETLMLTVESHSKMLLKQQDPMVLEKKVNTTPVDYAALNQLSQDFKKRFVPQTELSAEQDFWS
ncbi:hypothetical protein Tco_1012630 [Tanacetum coccineum]